MLIAIFICFLAPVLVMLITYFFSGTKGYIWHHEIPDFILVVSLVVSPFIGVVLSAILLFRGFC